MLEINFEFRKGIFFIRLIGDLNNKNYEQEDTKLKHLIIDNKLDLLNPLNILSKGYSVVTLGDDVIKSSKKVKVNDEVNVRLHEGKIKAVVKEIE